MAIQEDAEPGKATHQKEAELSTVCRLHMNGESFMYLEGIVGSPRGEMEPFLHAMGVYEGD